MRKSWENYIADDILKAIDLELDIIDRNWQTDCPTSPVSTASSSEIGHYDSLKSLPIISSKLKSENYILLKETHFDFNKENEDFELPSPMKPLWRVDIPDYPLFPEIGTDPRLLRRWYSSEKTHNITIDNRVYKLLLNRIQPCICVDDALHAVRFCAQRIQLKVNGVVFEIGLVGASTVRIFDKSHCVCLGGPGHELIVVGLPFHVPMDGDRHQIRVHNDTVDVQWIIAGPVPVNIMPAIPDHIAKWGWQGMFGSPRYLTQRPLNPMKPPISRKPPPARGPVKKPNDNDDDSDDKRSDGRLSMPRGRYRGRPARTSDEWGGCNSLGNCDRSVLQDLQLFNPPSVFRLLEMRICAICRHTFPYGDEMGFRDHLVKHDTARQGCFQLLNDWITAAVAMSTSRPTSVVSEHQLSEMIPKPSSLIDLNNLEANIDNELLRWDTITLKSEEIVKFSCESRVTICLTKGTAEIYGTGVPFNNKIELFSNHKYEILSFTGCKIHMKGVIKEVNLKGFHNEFYKANILINIHHKLELKRIEASEIEGRGPRLLIYGPGVEAFTMSTLTRTLANYSVRYGRMIALVNLDTIYNDTGLPNSISVNVIQSEFNLNYGWDRINDPLVFNFGQCSPVENQRLYFEQLEALANFLNIRCENDSNLLIGGCIINGGNFHCSEIIMKALELFEVDMLLFISNDEITNLRASVPEYVEIVNIPRNFFDTNFCPKEIESIRKNRIESYFGGNYIFKKNLSIHELNMNDVKVYYTRSFNDLDAFDFMEMKLEDISVNSVGALSQAATFDQINRSPILFYLVFVEISFSKSTITVLTEKEVWPKCFSIILLSGNFFGK